VKLTLRPASSVCPVAFRFGAVEREAVSVIPGVRGLEIRVENYNRAEELEQLLNQSSREKGAS
jgi:hypothetical protein